MILTAILAVTKAHWAAAHDFFYGFLAFFLGVLVVFFIYDKNVFGDKD